MLLEIHCSMVEIIMHSDVSNARLQMIVFTFHIYLFLYLLIYLYFYLFENLKNTTKKIEASQQLDHACMPTAVWGKKGKLHVLGTQS